MKGKDLILNGLRDPALRGWMRNGCLLRSYQADALRTIYRGIRQGKGGNYTVVFPRQSGKNETQAQLESAVMAANLHRGGAIIKLLPTEKNQGEVSRKRLENTLNGGNARNAKNIRAQKMKTVYGNTEVRYLSASPNAAIVGATADLMLEVDEAQMVPADKFDREAAPMAAANNAVQIFWGTVWDDRTLLARQTKLAEKEAEKDGTKHVFRTTAAEVGKEVPEYAAFVRAQIEGMGREHPAVRTQFFCEEISDLTGMFTPARLSAIRGEHSYLDSPEPGCCYVFLIDIAGSDELSAAARQKSGFSDRRDATVVTICEVTMPEGYGADPRLYHWTAVARRYYRNVPAEILKKFLIFEVEHWEPYHIILDHSGLGCMLTDFLSRKYPEKCLAYDITPANKTRMAWEFLAMIDSGRWKEYRTDEVSVLQPGSDPKRDAYEVLEDPALLQQMFLREMRACRMEPSDNGMTVRWGVKEGIKDPETGRFLHDDLVMSAALAVFENEFLPISSCSQEYLDMLRQEEEEAERRYQRWRWENF